MNIRDLHRSYPKHNQSTMRGFTLIEILIVIGMLAILSSVVLVAVNPLRQFAQARNSQRQSNVAAILNAVSERIADNGGQFISTSSQRTDSCISSLPSSVKDIGKSTFDLRPCVVPSYLSELPFDPQNGLNTCTTGNCGSVGENYDLGYTIIQDQITNRVTVCAPSAAESALPNSTSYCLSR
jgi:prepilin-type N-terminal cleavage/methylation domain-containing protein